MQLLQWWKQNARMNQLFFNCSPHLFRTDILWWPPEGTKLYNANQTPWKWLFTFIIIFISKREYWGICCNRLEFAHAGRVNSWRWCCGGAAFAADFSFEGCSIRCLCSSLFAGYSYFLQSTSSSWCLLHSACFRWFSSIALTTTGSLLLSSLGWSIFTFTVGENFIFIIASLIGFWRCSIAFFCNCATRGISIRFIIWSSSWFWFWWLWTIIIYQNNLNLEARWW